MKRRYTRSFWSNCWVVGLWLFATGRCVRLVITRSRTSRFHHLMGVTQRGHLIGFSHGRDPERAKGCLLYPLWFYGGVGGVKRSHKHRMYGERRVLGKL